MKNAASDARLREVSGLLAGRFGRPELCAHETEPILNLVLTILSQNTTDANRDRAFENLLTRFPTLMALAAARASEVEDAIRTGGLAKAKAKAILGALARILAAFQPAQFWLTHAAAALWIVAFGGFVALYWRVLTAPKPR